MENRKSPVSRVECTEFYPMCVIRVKKNTPFFPPRLFSPSEKYATKPSLPKRFFDRQRRQIDHYWFPILH